MADEVQPVMDCHRSVERCATEENEATSVNTLDTTLESLCWTAGEYRSCYEQLLDACRFAGMYLDDCNVL